MPVRDRPLIINDLQFHRVPLWVLCLNCGRVRKLEMGYVDQFIPHWHLTYLEEKLVCSECKSRRIAVHPDDRKGVLEPFRKV